MAISRVSPLGVWRQLLFSLLILVGWDVLPARAVGASLACLPVADVPGGTSAVGCGCANSSGDLGDIGDWGSGSASGGIVAKALPGTICQMNVGNINSSNGLKVSRCDQLQGRAAEVSGADCDVITVVELMSTYQCGEVCVPPTGNLTLDEFNAEACKVCAGCQDPTHYPLPPIGCKAEASVVCPSSQYDISCSQAPPSSVGCDCICTKKTQGTACGALPPSCQSQPVRTDGLSWIDKNGKSHDCSVGNYGTCTLCTDPNGGPSMGNCVVHPDHCNDGNDENDRARCLAGCSSTLLDRAAAVIAAADIRTMSGDFNCIPPSQGAKCDGGIVSMAACPWLDSSDSFQGMQVCSQTGGTAAVGAGGLGGGAGSAGNPNCMLDFVLSTDCGCGETHPVLNGITYGDHRTIIFGQGAPTVEYAGGGHLHGHGHYTVLGPSGNVTYNYSSDQWDGPFGFSCGSGASCSGQVVEAADACESSHQAQVREAVCSTRRPVKALLCETATAWGWSSGQGSGHGAETADTATASASASGSQWQAQCQVKRRVVDLTPGGDGFALSSPFQVLANTNAACTARTLPLPLPQPEPVVPVLSN